MKTIPKQDLKTVPALLRSKQKYKSKRLLIERRIFSPGFRGQVVASDVVTFPVPRSVAILPITDTDKILLERHYRYAPLQEIIEVPAGWLEKGERPAEGARRELIEETGYCASHLISLGTILPAPGYSTEEIDLFLAKIKRSPESDPSLEPGEVITTITFSKSQVVKLIRSGKIRDAMTISAVFRAQLKGLF